MKQEKEGPILGRILLVQPLDSGPRPLQQQFVSRQDLFRRIAEISQQSEVKMLIPIREMVKL